ncbi:hypothetical protein [uncultured Anaerofustis sp.]|uniref:hypothetical protein n=1 Tax=uncultured Anaerofustis sp. TaxID=904996 RepID=UPI0025FD6411|nr:hypothetical protein [uncultured Anaerofustis sp.]
MKKKRILTFIMTFLIAFTTLSTTVFGFNSYEQYFNGRYSYSLKIPKDKKNVVMETNQSSVLIPYSEQIRLEINVEDVSTLLTNKEQENYNESDLKKLSLKSEVFKNTYASEDYMKKNAVKLIKKFAPSPTVTNIESFKLDRRVAFKIFYDTKITGADNKTAKGHGLILFTIDGGRVYYFVFTDNSLKQANITDYDFIDKAISTINLEDFDYTPFILIGILCILLYVLLMSLYLKAERRAEERRERKRREKEIKRRRALGIEPISQDEDYEYYDEIVLEEADESEELDGESVFTVEQIMKLYPSLKDIKIRPRGDGKDLIETPDTENKNIIDYKEIEEDLDKKIKADKDREVKENVVKEETEKDTSEEFEVKEQEETKTAEVGEGLAAMTPVSNSEGFYELSEEEDNLKEEIGFELAGRREKGDKLSVKNNNIYDDDTEGFVFEDIDEENINKRNDNLDLSFREEYQSPEDSINMEDFGKEIDDDIVSDFDYSFEDETTGDIPLDEVKIDEADIVDNSDIGDELFEDILNDTKLDTLNNEDMTKEAEGISEDEASEMSQAGEISEDISDDENIENTDNFDDDLEEDIKDEIFENEDVTSDESDKDIDDTYVTKENNLNETVLIDNEVESDENLEEDLMDETVSKEETDFNEDSKNASDKSQVFEPETVREAQEELEYKEVSDTEQIQDKDSLEEADNEITDNPEDKKAKEVENIDTVKSEDGNSDNNSSQEDINIVSDKISEEMYNGESADDEDGFECIYDEVLETEESVSSGDEIKNTEDNIPEDERYNISNEDELSEETISEEDIDSIISEIDKEFDMGLENKENEIDTESLVDTSVKSDFEEEDLKDKSKEGNHKEAVTGDTKEDFEDDEIDEVLISNDEKEVIDEFSQMVDFLDNEE